MTRLVVQLPCQPPALDLLSGDDAAERVPGDAVRDIDGARGSQSELLRETEVGAAETSVRTNPVVRHENADRLSAHDEWDVEARGRTQPACDVLVRLGVLE